MNIMTRNLSIINARHLERTEGSSPYTDVSTFDLNLVVNGPISVIWLLNEGTFENGLRTSATARHGISNNKSVSKAASTTGYVPVSSVSSSAKNSNGPEKVNMK